MVAFLSPESGEFALQEEPKTETGEKELDQGKKVLLDETEI